MAITVLQGERELARDNWSLGAFEIEFEPAPKGIPRVGVQFEIDADGILHVLARDVKTGAQKVVDLKSGIDVSDEAVERMLSDSVEHAFEDLNERLWVETKLKSDEMLTAVDRAYQLVGDRIEVSQRDKVNGCVQAVRDAVEARDLQRLKLANQALDDATQQLAATVLDIVMQEPTAH
jgi:molecular chaperone DnaK